MPEFDKSVFINCPFDKKYWPIFRAIIFTVEYCGFAARSALELDDGSNTRVAKMIQLIRESRYAIHDISCTELNEHDLPRFNMPYEFGIFVGLRHSAEKQQKKKCALVLDREAHRYQIFMSDISGHDIHNHENKPDQAIVQVRNWLRAQTSKQLPGGKYICEQFLVFQSELPKLLTKLSLTESELENYLDYHNVVTRWVALNAAASQK